MGKGDKRTRKGKISAGSFGKSRPKKKNIKKAENNSAAENKTENKNA
jgi:30S ribosomal protein S31